MPPEVRTRILEYALSGNALHIFRNPNQTSMRTTRPSCKVCVSPCWCSVRITAFLASHDDRHRLHRHVCYTNVFGYRLVLSLLQSCSQIYMEASLLPFTQNHFIFGETELLPLFTSKLAPAQAAAITSLSLDNITVFNLFDDSYWTPFPDSANYLSQSEATTAAPTRTRSGCQAAASSIVYSFRTLASGDAKSPLPRRSDS
jgi:hypothetical protein